jgi:hypothetical protein
MTLIVLTAICFLACAFYVYILFYWMLDTKDKRTTRSAAEDQADGKQRRPIVIDSWRAKGTNARFAVQALRPAINAEGSRSSRPNCPECERNVYEKIAKSWSGKKTG